MTTGNDDRPRSATDATAGGGGSSASDARPIVPDRADGDRDEAWGEREDADASDRRLLEDRPPHHDGRSSW